MTESNKLVSGKGSILKNPNSGFFEKFGQLMENNTFKEFINEYFSTWDDSKASIMLLQHYLLVDEEYYKMTKERLKTEEIVNIMKNILMNREYRKIMMDGTNKFFDLGGATIREIYKENVKFNQKAISYKDKH